MRVLSILLFLLVFGVTTDAKYQYYNGRLHPTSSKTKISSAQLIEAVYSQQQELEALRVDLRKSNREIKKLKQQVTALEVLTKRLKNFFFKNF